MPSMNHSSDFDPISFYKYMEHSGRAYRKQATELVSLCRVFVRLGEESVRQDADLRRVLEVADEALMSASYTKKSTSKETDKKFENAIDAMSTYARIYHPGQRHVDERMQLAKETDMSSLKVLNRLKQSFRTKPTRVARFLILSSPLDESPTVVEQVLSDETRVEEIFWNFSRLEGNQRITLQQNPYFYKGLPRSARAYTHDFTAEPIENFRDATEILVLIDRQSRVFLNTDETRRVFGNVWELDEAIIFKDIHGRLQGDRVVEEVLQGTAHVWTRAEPSVAHVEPLDPLEDVPEYSGPANPPWNRTFQDWRQLVRDSLDSPNVNVFINTRDAPPENPVPPEIRVRHPEPPPAQLLSTVREVLPDGFRFRILVLGKRQSGKSTLISAVFNVDMNAGNQHGDADINVGFIPDNNRYLVVHEYPGIESGDAQSLPTILKFISSYTDANRPVSERLHAIWICVSMSDAIERGLGEGVEKLLGMKKVPALIVFTKFDLLVSRVQIKDKRGDIRDNENSNVKAQAMFEDLCRSLFQKDPKDVPAAIFSEERGYGGVINDLTWTTHGLLKADSHKSAGRPTTSRARPPVPPTNPTLLAWTVAQRVNHDITIQGSIEVGRSRYWRNLGSSLDFANHTLESCVNVIHEDIITIWNFDDREGYLFGREFMATMTHLVEDTPGMSEVEHADNHADRRTHLEERYDPEVRYLDRPNLALDETSAHAGPSTHPEEIYLDRPTLTLEEAFTHAGSSTHPEEIYHPEERYLDRPNLDLDEVFIHAGSRTHPEEIYLDRPNLALDVAFTPMAPWTNGSYQNNHRSIRYIMTYIVDLTVILHGLFLTTRSVSAADVQSALRDYRSSSGSQIHEDIRSFVEQIPLANQGRDMVMEKIIDLIEQNCVPTSQHRV